VEVRDLEREEVVETTREEEETVDQAAQLQEESLAKKSTSEFGKPDYLNSLKKHLEQELEKIHYVSRTLRSASDDEGKWIEIGSPGYYEEGKEWTEEEILDSKANFLITGESGIGKTTILQKLRLEAAKKKRIPVYIDLRGIGRSFEALKKEVLAEVYRMLKLSDRDFQKERFVFLFDHLDQAVSSMDESIRELVAERTPYGREDQYIVCCRINYDSQFKYLLTSFNLIVIEKLSSLQVWEILEQNDIERFNYISNTNFRLIEFGRNPFCLKLLIEIFKEWKRTGKELDITRETGIYEEYVKVYINSEARKRKTGRISPELMKGTLASLAFRMQESESSGVTLRTESEEYLRIEIPVVAEKCKIKLEENDIGITIEEIISEGLIYLSPDRNQYLFAHDSLRDFFYAWHLAKNLEEEKALRIILDKMADDAFIEITYPIVMKDLYLSKWQRIVTFFAGLKDDATSLLNMIIEKDQAQGGIFTDNLGIVSGCVVEAKSISSELLNLIVNKVLGAYLCGKILYDQLSLFWTSQSVRGEYIVEKLVDQLGNKNHVIREAAAFALGRMKVDEAIETLINSPTKDENEKKRLGIAFALGWLDFSRVDATCNYILENMEEESGMMLGKIGFTLALFRSKKLDVLVSLLAVDKDQEEAIYFERSMISNKDIPKEAIYDCIHFLTILVEGVKLTESTIESNKFPKPAL